MGLPIQESTTARMDLSSHPASIPRSSSRLGPWAPLTDAAGVGGILSAKPWELVQCSLIAAGHRFSIVLMGSPAAKFLGPLFCQLLAVVEPIGVGPSGSRHHHCGQDNHSDQRFHGVVHWPIGCWIRT